MFSNLNLDLTKKEQSIKRNMITSRRVRENLSKHTR